MENKTTILKIYIIFFLSVGKIFGQMIGDNAPLNSYFSNVNIVRLDEFANKRSGVIFYNIKSSYLNYYIIDYSKLTFKTLSDEFCFYKIYKNHYRYTDYELKIINQTSDFSNDYKGFIDSVKIEIWAKKNIKKFQVFKFKSKLKYFSDEKIYSGYIIHKRSVLGTEFPLLKEIKLSSSKIIIERNQYKYEKEIGIDTLAHWPSLFLNFNENILQENNLSIKNHFEMYFLGKTTENVYVGFPLDYYNK